MKISISLEKEASINMEIQRELAVNTFKAMADILLDAATNKSTKSEVTKIEKPELKIKDNREIDCVIHNNYGQLGKSSVTRKNSLQKNIIYNKAINKIPRSLVMVKCSECGKIAVIPLEVVDGKLLNTKAHLICKNCHRTLPISELKKGMYECPDCGTSVYFYVMGDIKEVHCKNCDSLIDLVWHDKKKKYLSPNLLQFQKR